MLSQVPVGLFLLGQHFELRKHQLLRAGKRLADTGKLLLESSDPVALNRQINLDQQPTAKFAFCLNFAVDRNNHPLGNGQTETLAARRILGIASEKWFPTGFQAHQGRHRQTDLNALALNATRGNMIAPPAAEKRKGLRTTFSTARYINSEVAFISAILPGA